MKMKNGKIKKYKEIKELKTIEKDIRQLQQTSLSPCPSAVASSSR